MKQNTDELVKLVEELRQLAPAAGFWKAHSIFTRSASALESLSAELQSAESVVEAAREAVESGAIDEIHLSLIRDALATHDCKYPAATKSETEESR